MHIRSRASSFPARWGRCTLLAAAMLAGAGSLGARAPAAEPVRLAVLPFELEDFSAGGGIIAPDARDAEFLDQATQEARRQLAGSGRYTLVDADGIKDEPAQARTLHSCGTCVGPIARRIGVQQAVVGTIKRINRTEYTLLVQFIDAASGEPAANYFTGLRMGANYSWPRGVKWLMKNRVLSEHRSEGAR